MYIPQTPTKHLKTGPLITRRVKNIVMAICYREEILSDSDLHSALHLPTPSITPQSTINIKDTNNPIELIN